MQQLHRIVVADVVEAIRCRAGAGIRGAAIPRCVARRGAVAGPHHPFRDVVDVREVATHLAIVEHVDRRAGQDRLREQEHRHVRTTPRAVHGEEAQAGGRDLVQVAVGVCHQLVGLLRRGVQRQRMIHVLVHAERHRRVGTVHARRRGVREVLHAVVPAALQHVHEADHVAVDVGVRILDRVPHSGLCREVDHLLESTGGEQRVHPCPIGDVELAEREAGTPGQARQTRVLQRRVVIVVQVVDADHLVAPLEQRDGDVRTDETGSAGEQDLRHGMRAASPEAVRVCVSALPSAPAPGRHRTSSARAP